MQKSADNELGISAGDIGFTGTETTLQLLQSDKLVKICAPMVRYSKISKMLCGPNGIGLRVAIASLPVVLLRRCELDLHLEDPFQQINLVDFFVVHNRIARYTAMRLAFRTLVRKYGCDVAFTPMIVSNSFVQSLKARDCEFTTNPRDRPLIVQFAANKVSDFANAAEIVQPYADGIDLNCGCPQRWAMEEGYGCSLLNKPHLLADMVKQTKERVHDDFSVSVKIRINHDIRKTVTLCQQAEAAGVSFISVHGRTPEQRTTPVNLEAIRLVKQSLCIPVVANGDVRSLQDAEMVHAATGVDGVMAARGMLENPAMYAGYESTPVDCVRDWIDLSLSLGTSFTIFHHHLIDMMDHSLPHAEKRVFNALTSTSGVIDFLSQRYGI